MKGRAVIFMLGLSGLVNAAPTEVYSGKNIQGIESIVNEATTSKEAWRVEANKRIRTHRMAQLDIEVVNKQTGKPIPNAIIEVRQIKHAFRFGGIASAQAMAASSHPWIKKRFTLSPETYRETFLQFGFNAAGLNNGLKFKQRNNHEIILPEVFDWFQSQDIPVRGHVLIWPGRDHMSAEMETLHKRCKADPDPACEYELLAMCREQVLSWATKWPVMEWDVINEPRGNHDIMDLLGDRVMVEWFMLARKYAMKPNVPLYINENRIISDPDTSSVETKNIRTFQKTADYLLENGAPLSGLGFQSRFHKTMPAELIYDRLCLFDKYNLPITATEFEMREELGGELEKAVMTERAMTVYFSHPRVEGIYAWTLFPSNHENEGGRNILNAEGQPNLRGKVWLYLMKNRWHTHGRTSSDAHGQASVRAFKGTHQITVYSNGAQRSVEVTLNENFSQRIEL